MKRWIIILVLVVLLAGMYQFQRYKQNIERAKPDYFLHSVLSPLADRVDIDFDPLGIPHVQVQVPGDFYRTLGWLHAQDRWFVLDALRHALQEQHLDLDTGAIRSASLTECPLIQTVEQQARYWESIASPDEVRRISMYIAGFNAFIHWMQNQNRFIGRIPGIQHHGMEPWTHRDVWRMLAFFWIRVLKGRFALSQHLESGYQIGGIALTYSPLEKPSSLDCSWDFLPDDPIVMWVIGRWSEEKPGKGVPYVAHLIWSVPEIPDMLYRVHWVFRKTYFLGETIAGTPFWFAGRSNFVTWLPYTLPARSLFQETTPPTPVVPDRIQAETVESPNPKRVFFPSIPDIVPEREFPSAMDWVPLLKKLNNSPVNWWVQDFYGNRLIGPQSPCPDYIHYRQQSAQCEFEWPYRPDVSAVTVCPGALCDVPHWPYPVWYEMVLAHASRLESEDWDEWVRYFLNPPESLSMTSRDALLFARSVEYGDQDPRQLDVTDVTVLPFVPVTVFRHPGRDAQWIIHVRLLHPDVLTYSDTQFLLTLSGWSPFDTEGITMVGGKHDLQNWAVTRWFLFNLREIHAARGLMLSPNYTLGGKVLGYELPRMWVNRQNFIFHTDPEKIVQVVVGRQIFEPAGETVVPVSPNHE